MAIVGQSFHWLDANDSTKTAKVDIHHNGTAVSAATQLTVYRRSRTQKNMKWAQAAITRFKLGSGEFVEHGTPVPTIFHNQAENGPIEWIEWQVQATDAIVAATLVVYYWE